MKVFRLIMLLILTMLPRCAAATNEFWFPVGEKLTYKLYWGIIPVGTSDLYSQWGEENGKTCLVLRATAKTGSFVAMIYPVDDFIESVVDPQTFLPVRYTQKLHEGRHVRDDTIIFDHKERKGYWKSGITGATNTMDILSDTRDVLCLTYYMRPKGTEIGAKEEFRVIVDDKLYVLGITVLGREDIKTPGMGKTKCLKIEPQARFGGIFVRKGRVMTWFSDDEKRICTRMEGKVPLANLKAILISVQGWEAKDETPND